MADLRQPINIDMQGVALRPQAKPVESYERPATPTKSNAGDFLSALGKIAPAVLQLGGELQRGPTREEKEAEAALVSVRSGAKTSDELAEEIKQNPNSNPVSRIALQREMGRKMAGEFGVWFEKRATELDPAAMDPDKLLKEYYDTVVLPKVGDNKYVAAGYASGAATLPDQIRSHIEKAKNKQFSDTRDDTVYGNMARDLEVASNDPEKITAILNEHRTNNQQFLAMSRKDQEKMLTRVAETFANKPGMEKVLDAIGDSPSGTDGLKVKDVIGERWSLLREKAEGTTLRHDGRKMQDDLLPYEEAASAGKLDEQSFRDFTKPFMDRGSMSASRINSLIQRNKNEIERQRRAALAEARTNATDIVKGELGPEDAETFRAGRAAEIADYEGTYAGKKVSIPWRERMERGAKIASDDIARSVKEDPSIPDEQKQRITRERQIAMYGKNGQVDPMLDRTLKQIANTTTVDDNLIASIKTYLPEIAYAQKAAPKQIYQVFNTKAERTFIDSLIVAHENGLSPNAAVVEAQQRRDMAEAGRLPALSREQKQKVLEDVTKKVNDTGFWSLDNDPRGKQMLHDAIERQADYWFGAGAKGDKLIEQVANTLKQNTVFVGKQYVPTSQLNVPVETARQVFDGAAAMLKEADPRYAKDDITFMPVRPGSTTYRAFAIGPTGMPQAIVGSDRDFTQMHRGFISRKAENANKKLEERRQAPTRAQPFVGNDNR